MDLLAGLNPQQRQAVTAPPGPVLVLAGPGSGKTRVLTYRIAWLIQHEGVDPYRILAVTFTNKAAREMGNRLVTLLEGGVEGIWLGTFHSVCARILRREQDYLPFAANFVIFDEDDTTSLVKRALEELKLDPKLYKPSSVKAAISNAKNNLIMPADYVTATYRDEVIQRIYTRYQELLITSNAVDFDDLLLYTWKIFNDNPPLCEKYASRFREVLVDEFQDTNLVQYELLRQLASVHNHIFVVGDEDQSIYRWRGADYRNVLRFEKDYTKHLKVLLEQNYRSTQTVLDAARAVIDRNVQRTPKMLRALPQAGEGEKLVLFEAVDDHGEAAWVAERIQRMTDFREAKLGDFAVMYRTNAQSRLLEEAFLRAGMPYRLVGAQRFYGRREVKDMIAYLRLVQNPDDEVSLLRVMNVPPRGLGDKSQVALQLAAQRARISAGKVLLDLAESGMESVFWEELGRPARLLSDLGTMLAEWIALLDMVPLPELFERIINDTGFRAYIDDNTEEGRNRWENVEELRRLCYEYADRGMTAFLENLALVSDQDTLPEQAEAPTLLTLHSAKGLEFPIVFITGLDDGTLPHIRAQDDPEEMAEERRLFYVGLTRARKRVFLVRAAQRSAFGSYQSTVGSRFLDDIPEGLIQGGTINRAANARRSAAARWETRGGYGLTGRNGSGQLNRPARPPAEQQFRAGMRVNHPSWGDGIIIDSRMQDGDETVDVAFESVGFKRLLASLANLKAI